MQVVSGPDLKARIMGMLTQIRALNTFGDFCFLCLTLFQCRTVV